MPVLADEPGDYRRVTNSLARFQETPRRLIFPNVIGILLMIYWLLATLWMKSQKLKKG
jgi:hypothetical protein